MVISLKLHYLKKNNNEIYNIYYNCLFESYKDFNFTIAEVGIFNEESLILLTNYFKKSKIHGFKNNNISQQMRYLNKKNIEYDIIFIKAINFIDQIDSICNCYKSLKPGGLLLIENIDVNVSENTYINNINHILSEYQKYYFVTINQNNSNNKANFSKIFVLIKTGDKPIFKNKNKITIITPSYRLNNLLKLKESINFEYVDEWIIVYDGSKIIENPQLFENDIENKNNKKNKKIREFVFRDENGISGNPQRNYALKQITKENTYLYYLDDDNLIHPNLYNLLDVIDDNKIYTFNQKRPVDVYPYVDLLKGNNIELFKIDTAMFLIDYKLCKNIDWILNKYNADGYYIKECYEKNKESHIYVDNELSYYNNITMS
jgi:hypothetical protein